MTSKCLAFLEGAIIANVHASGFMRPWHERGLSSRVTTSRFRIEPVPYVFELRYTALSTFFKNNFAGTWEVTTESNMERVQGDVQAGPDEGVWLQSRQSMGTGNRGTGHAQKGPTSEPSPVSVDEQLQPILRNDDAHNRGDHHQRLKVDN